MNYDVLITEWMRAMQARDAKAAIELCTPDIILDEVPMGPVQGTKAVYEKLYGFLSSVNYLRYEVTRQLVLENIAVIERITHISILGQKASFPVIALVEFYNGRISVWREYFDMKTFIEQISA